MKSLLLLALCLFPLMAPGKTPPSLLALYVENPANEFVHDDVLGLVEVTAVELDSPSQSEGKQTGILRLKTIESVKDKLPATFAVRFSTLSITGEIMSESPRTWDRATLKKGEKLLGFFMREDGAWAVRDDGLRDAINNVAHIDPPLLEKVQLIFKTPLRQ